MTHQAILAYNEQLIKCNGNCDILEYIRHINSMHKEPIDLSFMEDLLSFIEQTGCCIPHILLIKYGVFKETNASQHIGDTLKLYEMISDSDMCLHNVAYKECETCKYDVDYRLTNVRESAPSGGCTHRNIYMLKPDTFKFILMRSKCERKYAKYYILLEKCIKYYHDYQIACKNSNIKVLTSAKRDLEDERNSLEDDVIESDIKVNTLEALLIEVRKQGEEARQRDVVLQLQNATLTSRFNTMQMEMQIAMSTLNNKVDKMAKRLPDCINVPPKKNQSEWLVIMQKPNTRYLYVIRTQMKNLNSVIAKKEADGYIEINALPETEIIPNSVTLWLDAKDKMIKEKMISCSRNNITLREPHSLSDFVQRLNKVFTSRENYE